MTSRSCAIHAPGADRIETTGPRVLRVEERWQLNKIAINKSDSFNQENSNRSALGQNRSYCTTYSNSTFAKWMCFNIIFNDPSPRQTKTVATGVSMKPLPSPPPGDGWRLSLICFSTNLLYICTNTKQKRKLSKRWQALNILKHCPLKLDA